MKHFRVLFFFITSLFLFTSCLTMRYKMSKAEEKNMESVDLLRYNEIDIESEFVKVGAGFGLNMNMLGNSFTDVGSSNYGLSFGGNYHHLKFGEVDFDGYVPLRYTKNSAKDLLLANDDISDRDLSLILKTPLYKYTRKIERIIPAIDDDNRRYLIYGVKTLTYHKLNVRLGAVSDFNKLYTNAYLQEILKNKNAFSKDFDLKRGLAEVSQENVSLRAGFEYQFLANSFIDVIDKNKKKYYGKLSAFWSFYFDFLVLLNHTSNNTTYNYFVSDADGNDIRFSEKIDPSDIFDMRKYGFAVGLQSAGTLKEKGKLISSSKIEIGISPGYFRNFKSALYINLGAQFGIGGFLNVFKKEI